MLATITSESMDPEQDATAATETPPGSEGPSRILVIDDEEVIHVSLRRILGRQGHEVDAVLDAKAGLARLEQEPYDLVITDLMMPGMNGIELLERMAELKLAVPVMMITAYPTIKTAVEALRLGAVDFLAKPFTRRELLAPVNRTLRGREQEEEPAVAETGGDADGFAEPSVKAVPGDRFRLRGHSWAVYRQDGTVRVGIAPSFLESAGAIRSVRVPEETDLVEQGFAGIHVTTAEDEEHAVFMPLSGQVLTTHAEALATPEAITGETWLLELLPVNLEGDLAMLLRD
jgi:CheY-like chemotaxis protein